MGERLRENWKIISFVAFITAFASIATTSAYERFMDGSQYLKKKEFVKFKDANAKAHKAIVVESQKYTDDEVSDLDEKNSQTLAAIKELFQAISDGQKTIIESMDKRLIRLEDNN